MAWVNSLEEGFNPGKAVQNPASTAENLIQHYIDTWKMSHTNLVDLL